MQIVGGLKDLWRGGLSAGGGLGGPAVWISSNRTSGIAPAGVFFEAVVSGFSVERPAHDLRYKWTFGDGATYSALAADHPQGTAADVAFGPVAAHCFAAPGLYTVQVEVTDGLSAGVATLEVTVTDPDTAYAGAATYAIAGSGGFAGASAGAVQVATLEAALAHAQAAGRRKVRFQFCRSASHGAPATIPAAGFDEMHLSAYGTGTAPVLNGGLRTTNGSLAGTFTAAGLTLRGGFDPKVGGAAASVGMDLSGAAYATLNGLDIAGFGIGVRFADGQANAILSDSRIADWADRGVSHDTADRSAVLGCSILMDPDTLPTAVANGPGRLGGVLGRYVVWHCDLFSAGGQGGHAPCWRWNADASAGAFGVIGYSRLEGGAPVLALGPEALSVQALPGELIVEKCFLLGSAATGEGGLVTLGYGGTSLRSSILVLPDVPPEAGVDPAAFVTGGGAGSSQRNNAAPVVIYSNALVDLRGTGTLANPGRTFAITRATDFVHLADLRIANNLIHAPALAVPVTPHAPLDTATVFAPRYRGKRSSGGVDTVYATPVASASLFAPAVGGGNVPQAEPGALSVDDFRGAMRDLSPELGAFEYSSTLSINIVGGGTFQISGVGPGVLQLTVDPPSIHAGTHDLDIAALEHAPVLLTPPTAAGTAVPGQSLTAVSGLVAYGATDGQPVVEWAWFRASEEVGTGPTYVVQAADPTFGLTLRQRVTNSAPFMTEHSVSLIAAVPPAVSGTTGSLTVVSGADFDDYVFTGNGSITFSNPGVLAVELLGGGGGGGDGFFTSGGGGGAGALVTNPRVAVSAATYSVVVGAGGAGGIYGTAPAAKGGTTSGFDLTAEGGGAGINTTTPPGAANNGACGGGASSTSGQVPGTGSVGGNGGRGQSNEVGGGGGGMGGDGGDYVFGFAAGAGGSAVQSGIDGVWLAEGGGGGSHNPWAVGAASHGGGVGGYYAPGGNAVANTGSGGGGAGGVPGNGGNGSAGRVVVRIAKTA